jgi:serine/threonine-protein kinase
MTSAPPSIALRVGDTLGGKLLLEAELGRGGMGLVFRARHLQFDERVAVKVLLPTTSKRAAARFDREIRASMRMRGEHTVRVLDAGREGDCPYLVMEFLEGCDLRGLLAQRGPLPCDEVVGYLLQACEGISEAHSLGVVHRDLKPANLFLTRRFDGTPQIKVLDFGVAKALLDEPSDDVLTSSSTSIGTPMYMAPEQIRDAKRVDERADI